MKKLMMLMGAAAMAFTAKATTTIHAEETFENITVGEKPTDTWLFPADATETAVKAYGTDIAAPSTGNARYLNIDSTTAVTNAISRLSVGVPDATEIGVGLNIDTLVKFTAADTAPVVSSGDKIIVWMYDDTANNAKKLIVTAGYMTGAQVDKADYVVSNDATLKCDYMHELTIKANTFDAKITDDNTKKLAAFQVSVDGVACTITGTLTRGEDGTTIAGVTDSTDVGNDTYAGYITDGVLAAKLTAGQLFPSMVTDSAVTTLASVGFQGTGAVDNFSVTADEITTATLTLTAGTGVTLDETKFTGLKEGDTVEFTVKVADGYVLDDVTIFGTKIAAGKKNTLMVPTLETAAYAYTISASKASITVVDAEGIEQIYSDLATAVTAAIASGKPVTLNGSVSFESESTIDIGANGPESVTIDLNGNTLTIENNCYLTAQQDGVLTIKDSSSAKTGKIVAGASASYVISNAGTVNIEAGTFDGGFEDQDGTFVLTGGSYLATLFTTGEAFTLVSSVDKENYEVTKSGDYWVVSEKTGDTCTLTLPTVTGATAVVTNGTEEVSDLTKIASNATVTVYWTATEGYTITDGATEEITMTGDKTAATPTVTADSQEIKPGETEEIEAEDQAAADAKAAAYTPVAANDEAAAAGQASVLKVVAVKNTTTGKYDIKAVIDETKITPVADTVAQAAVSLPAIAAADENATVNVSLAGKVTPGLYYSIGFTTDVGADADDWSEGNRVLATETNKDSIAPKVTRPEGTKAFFKVLVNTNPKPEN